LTEAQQSFLDGYFDGQVYPVLTPLAIDPAHPVPHLHNKSLNLILRIETIGQDPPRQLDAVLQVPPILSRLVALPDVGDTVLVVLPSGGAGGVGVVMGGLYGTKSPPDSGVEGGATKRYTLRTPAGQLVTLDDANKAVRLEDETGSYLELTPEKVLLHAAVDLALEAPGRAVTVTGNTIDFRQG
jgi:hypothetical protein